MFYNIIYKLKGGNTVPEKDFDNEQNSHHVNSQIITKEHQLINIIDGSQLNTKIMDILNLINIFSMKNFDILKKDYRLKDTVGDPLFTLDITHLNAIFNLDIIKSLILSSTQMQMITNEESFVHSQDEEHNQYDEDIGTHLNLTPLFEGLNTTQNTPTFTDISTVQYSFENVSKKIGNFAKAVSAELRKVNETIINLLENEEKKETDAQRDYPQLFSVEKLMSNFAISRKSRLLFNFYDMSLNLRQDKYKEFIEYLAKLNNDYDQFQKAKYSMDFNLHNFTKYYDVNKKLFNTGKIGLKDTSQQPKIKLAKYLNFLNDSNTLHNLTLTKDFINLPLDLNNLVKLNASNCNISNIPNYFNNLVKLNMLDLNNNNISDLTNLSNLTNLEILFLNNNNITEIDPLLNLDNLGVLTLNHNNVLNINSLLNLRSLYMLSLSNNNYMLPLELNNDNSSLYDINLSNNKISEINEINLPNLKNLNLSNNKIHSIERIPISNLEKLNLSNNNLFNEQVGGMDATFSPTPLESSNNKLKKLNLSNNKINGKFFEYITNNNINLQELYLDNITNIQDLDPDFFNNLINIINSNNTLKKLSLSKNSLFRFNFDLSNSNNLDYVNLSRNNLNSDKISELANLIKNTKEINLNDNNFNIEKIENQKILSDSKIMHLDGNNIRDKGIIHLKNIISNSRENNFEISIKRNYITNYGINNFISYNKNENNKIIRKLDISHNINFGDSIFELIRYYEIRNLINKNNIYNPSAPYFSFFTNVNEKLEIIELDISNTSAHSNNDSSIDEWFYENINAYKLNVMNLNFDNCNLKYNRYINRIVIENKNINISAKYNNFGNLKMNDMPQNINFIGNYDFSNNQFVNYFKDKVYNLVPSFEFGVDDLFPLNEQLTITEIKLKKFKNLDSIENSGKLMVSMHPFYEIIPLNFDILNEELELYEYKNANAKFNIVLTNLLKNRFLFFKEDLFEDNDDKNNKRNDDESYTNNNCEYFMNLNEKLYLSFESAVKLGIIPRKNDKIILYKDFQFFDFDFNDIEIHKTMLYDKNNDSYTNEYGLLYKENESANTSSQPVNNIYKFLNLINLNSNLCIYDKLIKNKNELMKIVDEYMGNEKEKTEGELEYFKNLDLSLIKDLSELFSVRTNPNAKEFNLDISGWKTHNVVNANSMFYGAEEFNQDISGWNTQSLEVADFMFFKASQFNQDLGSWNLLNLESANFMFYGTTFNKSKYYWNLNRLKFAYQMFNNEFNKDIVINALSLETKNISLNEEIEIIDNKKFNNKTYFRTNEVIDWRTYLNIEFHYEEYPNFKSFWGNIIRNVFNKIGRYTALPRGRYADWIQDNMDLGGYVKTLLYSHFIKYSFYTHDMEKINKNINNYTDHFKKSCEVANNIIEEMDLNDIEKMGVNDINKEIRNIEGEENTMYKYACEMFRKLAIISRPDVHLPTHTTDPDNDSILDFFFDTNSNEQIDLDVYLGQIDANRGKFIDLIHKIYYYKTYLNNNPKPIREDYTKKNIKDYDNNIGQATIAFVNALRMYQLNVDKKLKEIHTDFFKIFEEQLSTRRLKDYYELIKQSKLCPFIFKENKLLLNKDIISDESRDYFREIYGIVMETGIQAPAQDDVISILYQKIGIIFASYLTHEIRFMNDRRGYPKNSIKFTKIFLLFLFKNYDQITIPELLDAILEINNFNIKDYLKDTVINFRPEDMNDLEKTFFDYEDFDIEPMKPEENIIKVTKYDASKRDELLNKLIKLNNFYVKPLKNPVNNFLSSAFDKDYQNFLNQYRGIEEEESKGIEEEESTFNRFDNDLFNNKETAKVFCIYNFILDKTFDLFPYWNIFKGTLNSQIRIVPKFNFRKMISHYSVDIEIEKAKYLGLLNDLINGSNWRDDRRKKIKALNFLRRIIEEADTNDFDRNSQSENLNLPKFFKEAYGLDSSPDVLVFGWYHNGRYFKFHFCTNSIDIPLFGLEDNEEGNEQEFYYFRNSLLESVYASA